MQFCLVGIIVIELELEFEFGFKLVQFKFPELTFVERICI